ncbi:MAG: hypothetical protein ISN29_12000 [Gammaproteobacteria bacterium AqS3]|nr:hypothetical protein [Gammaproteobacteria bacterium AqS3]
MIAKPSRRCLPDFPLRGGLAPVSALALILAGLLVSAPAAAQKSDEQAATPETPEPPVREQRRKTTPAPTSPVRLLEAWTRHLDRNNDGIVSSEEWSRELAGVFDRIDKGRDGVLGSGERWNDHLPIRRYDEEESDSTPGRRKSSKGRMAKVRRDALLVWAQRAFADLDSNRDGVISLKEREERSLTPVYDLISLRLFGDMELSIRGRPERALQRQKITRSEFEESGEEVFSRIDTNENGELTLLEIIANVIPYDRPKPRLRRRSRR